MSDEEVDELLKAVDTSSGEINYTGEPFSGNHLLNIGLRCFFRACQDNSCKLGFYSSGLLRFICLRKYTFIFAQFGVWNQ